MRIKSQRVCAVFIVATVSIISICSVGSFITPFSYKNSRSSPEERPRLISILLVTRRQDAIFVAAQQKTCHSVLRHYLWRIVVPRADLLFFQRLYKNWHNARIESEDTVLSHAGMSTTSSGWEKQQDVKISGVLTSPSPYVVILDADTLCSGRPFCEDDWISGGRIKTCMETLSDKHFWGFWHGHYARTAHVLNVTRYERNIILRLGSIGWTPQILSRDALILVFDATSGLRSKLMEARKLSRKNSMYSYTEYFLYFILLVRFQLWDSYHEIVDSGWHEKKVCFEGDRKELVGISRGCLHARIQCGSDIVAFVNRKNLPLTKFDPIFFSVNDHIHNVTTILTNTVLT